MRSEWNEWVNRLRAKIIVIFLISFVVSIYFIYSNSQQLQILSASTKMFPLPETTIQSKPILPVFNKRVVHLDLKGAPPKVSFYEKFFPLLKEIGITSVLMEYEDMFPYWGELSVLQTKHAYNNDSISQILKLAKENSLEIIPLVQTFGHMEFVLKHQAFSSLREVPEKSDAICPSDANSSLLIREMLNQIQKLHPHINSIHIGSDEVWNIAKDERCSQKLQTEFQNSSDRLKLSHISSVAKYAKDVLKFESVYAWNDMFANIESDLLIEYDLGRLLIPVVWGYAPDVTVDGYFPNGMFQRYEKVFPNMLFASAFKGANGPNETFLNIDRYFANLLSYHRLLSTLPKKLQNRVTGIVFTGWQRYFHAAPLCEILPVGMPSLINEAMYEKEPAIGSLEQQQRLLNFMKCKHIYPVQVSTYNGHIYHYPNETLLKTCEFLGVDAYREIEDLRFLKWKIGIDGVLKNETLLELNNLKEKLKHTLLQYFYEDAVDEWIAQNLNPQTIVPTQTIY